MPRRILWAEDNADDRELFRAVLDTLDDAPKVAFASDGQAALESLPKVRPDLMVMDLKMPRMGGIEALERIRKDPRWASLPVVIFSSSKQMHEVSACEALGVRAYVQKPIGFEALTHTIARLIAPPVPV